VHQDNIKIKFKNILACNSQLPYYLSNGIRIYAADQLNPIKTNIGELFS